MIKEVNYDYLKEFSNDTNTPFRRYFCYEENNNIIGYVIIDILYDRVEVINIFVKKEERNRKIGTNMLKYVIDLVKSKKLYNITLEVSEDNIFARKLYEKFSFKEVAKREKYYQGKDGILMELIL